MKRVITPLTQEVIRSLKAGDEVLLTGIIYTARDRAHKRMVDLIACKKPLPVDIKNQVIYYCGPNIYKGKLGACGPTTSSRMDLFTEQLLKEGLLAVIGKGERDPKMRSVFKEYKAVYFVTYAGCAAYLREKVTSFKVVAFPELEAEAVYEFVVEDFPLIVGIDSKGKDIYENLAGRR